MPEQILDTKTLQDALVSFKTDLNKTIEDLIKKQSDSANIAIADLKTKLDAAEKGLATLQELSKKGFGLPGAEKEKGRFSWAKYWTGLYKNHLMSKGALTVSEVQRYWDTTGSFEQRISKDYIAIVNKDYNATDGTSGGMLVPPQIYQGDLIDVVYANTAIMKMPILKFLGLTADMPIPVKNGHMTVSSLGETEAPAKSSNTFGLKWVRPKKLGVYTIISNRILYETNNAIESIVKGDMAMDASVELSRCLTNGKGSDSEGRGIMSYYADMTDKSDLSTNGRKFTIDDLADMKMSLACVDELRDTPTYGAIMHPAVEWGMIREKGEMYSGQAERKGMPKVPSLLLDKSVIANATKLSIESTTQIAKTTVGTSATCSKVVVGDWSKFVYATFRDPVFKVSDQATVDGQSMFLTDQIAMVMQLEYDCVCLRPAAFCGRDGAETNKSNW
jgi:HK97 family phage major capsid protein